MIVDSFDYIACYKGLHPNLDKAIDWLNSHTLDALENGKTIIDGENVFVNVMDADLRDADGAAFEYHRRYADLQIDLTGSEHWGWASEGKEQGEFDVAFAIASILMVLTLLINLSATLVGRYFKKRRSL